MTISLGAGVDERLFTPGRGGPPETGAAQVGQIRNRRYRSVRGYQIDYPTRSEQTAQPASGADPVYVLNDLA